LRGVGFMSRRRDNLSVASAISARNAAWPARPRFRSGCSRGVKKSTLAFKGPLIHQG
jgi:hypothetical protein